MPGGRTAVYTRCRRGASCLHPADEDFYFRASDGLVTAPPADMTRVATGQVAPTGLSPDRAPTNLASLQQASSFASHIRLRRGLAAPSCRTCRPSARSDLTLSKHLIRMSRNSDAQ